MMYKFSTLVAGLMLSMAATAAAPVASDYAGGTGTEQDPYQIQNRAQLGKLVAGADGATTHYRLTADIDLSGAAWSPIAGTFQGKLHGGNHLIHNITGTGGLFATLGAGAYIDSLHIVSGTINATTDAGALANQAGGTDVIQITACTNSASVTSTSIAGGLIGARTANNKLTITKCANLGNVTSGGLYASGIIGKGTGSAARDAVTIDQCYNAGTISTTNSGDAYVGAIAGYLYYDTPILTNNYSQGCVFSKYTAGIAGRIYNNAASHIENNVALMDSISGDASHAHPILGYDASSSTSGNNYSLTSMVGISTSVVNAGRQNGQQTVSLSDAKTSTFYTTNLSTWDFTNTWTIREDLSYPYFQYQSAPVVMVGKVTSHKIKLNLANATDSVLVYDAGKAWKATLKQATTFVGVQEFIVDDANLSTGSTVYFVTCEAGKAPSYPVKSVVDETPVESVAIVLAVDPATVVTASDVAQGGQLQLAAIITPANATNKIIDWSITSNGTGSTVDPSTGVVTAGSAGGTETVTATSNGDNSKIATLTLTVKEIPVTSVTIEQGDTLKLEKDATGQLTVAVLPVGALKDVTWTSGDQSVATVASDGTVTGVGVGITYVTATSDVTTTVTDTIWVKVRVAVSSVTISGNDTVLVQVGHPLPTFTADVSPAEATYPAVTWLSRNEGVITVDPSTGAVTGTPGRGITYIVATAHDDGFPRSDSVAVKVSYVVTTGDGSEAQPYLVYSRADLEELALFTGAAYAGSHFRLTADIDLSGGAWSPIATSSSSPFRGTLHGGGHLIKDIQVSASSGRLGLFAILGADAYIDSLHIVGGSITGTNTDAGARVGSIAADINGNNVVITGCSNSANLANGWGGSNTSNSVGGIVGSVSGGTGVQVTSCFNTGSLTGGSAVGGIIGGVTSNSSSVAVTNCYSVASIKTSATSNNVAVGGLVGYAINTGSILVDKSYARGSIFGSGTTGYNYGGLIGKVDENKTDVVVSNSVALQDTIRTDYTGSNITRVVRIKSYTATYGGQTNNYANASMALISGSTVLDRKSSDTASVNGADITLAQAQSQAFYSGTTTWDFADTWAIREGASYPYFRYQSAPVVTETVTEQKVILNLANAADSVLIFSSLDNSLRATLKNVAAGSVIRDLANGAVAIDEELYLVVYEAGKAPSYPVRAAVKAFVPVSGVEILYATDADDAQARTAESVSKGIDLPLKARVLPANATDKGVTWTIANAGGADASISNDDVVATGNAEGTATVTATSNDDPSKTANLVLTIFANIAVDSINITADTLGVEVDSARTLTAHVYPAGASDQSKTWVSRNTAVATVDNNGVVTGVVLGETFVVAITTDGEKTDSVRVIVKVPVTGVTISGNNPVMAQAGGTQSFAATVAPDDATVKAVRWLSRNASILAVDPVTGVATFVGKGSACVVAEVNDFGAIHRDSVEVKVIGLSGQGTAADPLLITDRATLEELADFTGAAYAGFHFRLTADVDLSGGAWSPIAGTFQGKLHGGNHLIKNIAGTGGLFAALGAGAYIDSLHIVGGAINATTDAGALANQAVGTGAIQITACTNSASVTSTGIAGGLIGARTANNKLTITKCANLGNVTGGDLYAGGIIGSGSSTSDDLRNTVTIDRCYNMGTISATGSGNAYAGVIAGYLYRVTPVLTNNYSLGRAISGYGAGMVGRVYNNAASHIENNVALMDSISGDDEHAHPILGYNAASHTSANNYALENIPGTSGKVSDAGKQNGQNELTLADARSAAWYTTNLPTWDFAATWAVREGESYPYFQYQSAPVVALVSVGAVRVNTAAAGSVYVYKGAAKTLDTILTATPGDNTYAIDGLAPGDALYFVVYEAGKAPSYPVKALVASSFSTVTFVVTDMLGVSIPDAVVTFDETVAAAGSYVFADVAEGSSYSYSVAKEGYEAKSGSVTVSSATVEVPVALTLTPTPPTDEPTPPTPATYTVTFTVKNAQGAAITDATITFDGKPAAAGHYVFADVADNTYSYSVAKQGYETKSSSVTVAGDNVDEPVTLTASSTGVGRSEGSVEVKLYPNPVRGGQAIGVELPNGGSKATVSIYDLSGKLLVRYSGTARVLAPKQSGVYLLKVELPGGATSVRRIAVE